jgi:Methyltransferase domain
VSRASIALEIAQGNHGVSRTHGPIRKTTGIVCLHAPLRAKAALECQKVEQGRRVEEVTRYLQQAWHIRRWRRLADEGGMDAEWAANSYSDDCLDVGGVKHPLAFDTTLRDLVSPWLDGAGDRTPPLAPLRQTPSATNAEPIAELDSNTVAAIMDSVAGVEGWLRPEEAAVLIKSTRRALTGQGDPAVVEVGSYCGKSTIVLAGAAKTVNDSSRVYAIDPHEGRVGSEGTADGLRTELPTFERFCRNVSAVGLSERVVPIRCRSYEVEWHLPIGLLFIDGLHDYLSVARDFYHFEPYLADGAYVAFHDCDDSHPGVGTFVAGLVASGCYEQVERAASLIVFHRVESRAHEPRSSDPNGWNAMNLRLSRQEKGIAFLMGELALRNRTIQERDEGIEWLRSVVRDKESTIAGLENGVGWLRKEIAERDVLISALRHDLEALRQTASRPDAPDEPWPLTQHAPEDTAE